VIVLPFAGVVEAEVIVVGLDAFAADAGRRILLRILALLHLDGPLLIGNLLLSVECLVPATAIEPLVVGDHAVSASPLPAGARQAAALGGRRLLVAGRGDGARRVERPADLANLPRIVVVLVR